MAAEPVAASVPNGRYDSQERRVLKRSGRQRGGWAYIPAEELARAGFTYDGTPTFYRVWGSSRGGLFVRLYREK